LVEPNIIANPATQNAIELMPKTMKFFARMLTAFLRRHSPSLQRAEAQVHEEHEHARDQRPQRVGDQRGVGNLRHRVLNRRWWRGRSILSESHAGNGNGRSHNRGCEQGLKVTGAAHLKNSSAFRGAMDVGCCPNNSLFLSNAY
jgi:hypothetical protein